MALVNLYKNQILNVNEIACQIEQYFDLSLDFVYKGLGACIIITDIRKL